MDNLFIYSVLQILKVTAASSCHHSVQREFFKLSNKFYWTLKWKKLILVVGQSLQTHSPWKRIQELPQQTIPVFLLNDQWQTIISAFLFNLYSFSLQLALKVTTGGFSILPKGTATEDEGINEQRVSTSPSEERRLAASNGGCSPERGRRRK